MKREKAEISMTVAVLRPNGELGKRGPAKTAFSAFCGAESIPTHGVIERAYPRFAVLRMLPAQDAPHSAARLYREAFFWEELKKA